MMRRLLTRLTHGARRMWNYRRRFGWRATGLRLWRELQGRGPAPALVPQPPPTDGGQPPTAAQWVRARFEALEPLPTHRSPPAGRRRVTVVTDSISPGSLFGGVGTALILATLVANRRQADLRIVTRTEAAVPGRLNHVLQANGLRLEGESQFRFLPPADTQQTLDLYPGELVITTSWWTTAACLPGVGVASMLYLLQEDERMFYPLGDEWLRCERVLQHPQLRVVVNTELLRQHLLGSGVGNLSQRSTSFEPAFPSAVFHPRPRPAGGRRRLVFYARPNNARNLFFLGLEVLEAAFERGVLDPAEWDLVFVGKDIPEVCLAGRVRPQRHENLSWSAYAELVGTADLGLSLMYTPHPSYPPLDMVASGAVVVSNRFGLKRDLSHLCPNLLLCEPERDALVQGLADGVALVRDAARREANFRQCTLPRDWAQAMEPVVAQLADAR